MLGITLFLSIIILYVYFTKNKNIKRNSLTSLKKNQICNCCDEEKIKTEQILCKEKSDVNNNYNILHNKIISTISSKDLGLTK